MGKLTLAQIDSATAHAKAAGFSDAEVEGVRLALLTRAAMLDGAQKLALAIDMMPDGQAVTVGEFLSAMGNLGRGVMARGAAGLNAISDEEWEQMLDEGGEDDAPESV